MFNEVYILTSLSILGQTQFFNKVNFSEIKEGEGSTYPPRYSARLPDGLSAVLLSVIPLCYSLINDKTILQIKLQRLAHAQNSERQENPKLWAESSLMQL